MFKNAVKIASRSLWKNKSIPVLNIFGLAVASALAIFIFMWIDNEQKYEKHIADYERVFYLTEYIPEYAKYGSDATPFPAAEAISHSIPEVEYVGYAAPSIYKPLLFKTKSKNIVETNALLVDTNWLKINAYKLIQGSIEAFSKQANSIILSESTAIKYFGNEPALGQTLTADTTIYSVVGIMEDPPAYSSLKQELLISSNAPHVEDLNYWGYYSQIMLVKLRDQRQAKQVEKKITQIFKENQKFSQSVAESRLIPVADLHFHKEFESSLLKKGNSNNLLVFTVLAFLILTTAGINFVNLSIANMSTRLKEIGVRKLVGASKPQLFWQIMLESCMMIIIAMLLAIILVIILIPHFNIFIENKFVFSVLDKQILAIIGGISLFLVLLTGTYPALLLAGTSPIRMLKSYSFGVVSKMTLRKVLVGAQVSLTVIMIFSVLVISRQFKYIQQNSMPYQEEQLIRLTTPAPKVRLSGRDPDGIERYKQSLRDFRAELLRSSSIAQVSQTNGVTLLEDKRARVPSISFPDYPFGDNKPLVVELWVDEYFAEVSNLKLLEGKWFDPNIKSDRDHVILNETAVQQFGLKKPVIGTEIIGFSGEPGIVIGVVEDYFHKSIHESIDPVVFMMDPFMSSDFFIKTQKGQFTQSLIDIEKTWKSRYADAELEMMFMSNFIDRLYKEDQKAFTFTKIMGITSILISCLGLLGMVISNVNQRTKEIGVRKVLGASVLRITQIISYDFLKLVFLAILMGAPISYWVMKEWLNNFAYRTPIAWWVLGLAGLVTMMIAILTVGWRSISAARINPVQSLRDE